MSSQLKKGLWFGVMIVVAAALAFAGPSLIAGINDRAVAADGCAMAQGSSMAGCGMTGGAGSTQAAHQGCAMLTGQAVAVDKRDGSVTVKIKPAAVGGDPAKKALSLVRVGDNLSLAVMVDKDGKPLSPNTAATAQAVKYVCPMHPEVTSDKPGTCPKCGMKLELVPEPKR